MNKAFWMILGTWLCACVEKEAPSMVIDADMNTDAALPRGDADVPSSDTEQIAIEIGEFTFQALAAGPAQGEAVFLLHGFPQTSMQWEGQIAALAGDGYRVVAPDQRGYSPGARPAGVGEYAMSELVQDVLAMADALAITRFHLVGHDWGAYVAWYIAGLAPDRVLSLAAISVPHPDAFAQVLSDPMSCQLAASAYVFAFVAPDAEAYLLRDGSAALRELYDDLPQGKVDAYLALFDDEESLRGGLNWYRANPAIGMARTPLGKIGVPTLYLWSDADAALCRDGAEITGDYVTGPYRFEVLEGVSHWVPEVAASRVNTLLREHLRTQRASESAQEARTSP
jgi:pimeloyl-ACP methyl ester carboxylesterase